MKITNIIHHTINAMKRLALASGFSALVALTAGNAQALTTTIELGAQDNGTTIGQGEKVLKIDKGVLPARSILKSVAISATEVYSTTGVYSYAYVGDICVFVADSDGANGVLLVGDYDSVKGASAPTVTTNVLWNAGDAYLPDSPAVDKTITSGIPAIDLNSSAIFLTSGYGGTWSGSITLTYDIGETVSDQTLIWNVAGGGPWDKSSINWIGQPSGSAMTFSDGLDVIFNNTAGATITIAADMRPNSTTVNNSAGTLQFSNGQITGSGGLTKSGAGTLQLNAVNSYTGKTIVQGGRLRIGNNTATYLSNAGDNGALGAPTGANATIDFYNGTIFQVGSSNPRIMQSTDRTINLADPIGGGTVYIRVNDNDTSFTFGEVTATGAGPKTLALTMGYSGNGDRTVMTFNGAISNCSDDSPLSLTVADANGGSDIATLNLLGANTFTGSISLATPGGAAVCSTAIGGSGSLASGNYNNTISMAERSVFKYASSADQILSGVISGPGALQVTGSGILTLSGLNTYSTTTTVNSGSTLVLGSTGGLTFVVTDAISNKLTGGGTATLDGSFTIDTSAVTAAVGSWTLVDTVTKSFGSTFGVTGYAKSGSDFTKVDESGRTWTFDTTTGTLSVTAPAMITSFGFPGSIAAIDQGAKTITLLVPSGTDFATLAPTYTLSSGICVPASGVAPSPSIAESNPATYTVAFGSTENLYTVTVSVSPLPLSGLTVWLQADAVNPADLTQVDGSGNVLKWNDQSGKGNHAAVGSQAAPTYVASALNSKPVLRFAKSDDNTGSELKLGDLSAQFPTAGSLFAVATVNTSTYNLFGNRDNDNDERWVNGQWSESHPGSFRVERANGTFNQGAWPTSGSHVFALESSSSVFRVLKDGGEIGNDTANYNNGSGQNWTIGDRANGGQQFGGDIPEFILYNRVLTTEEANQVGWYLSDKYAVTTSYLPPPVTPVALTDLTATPAAGAVDLSWTASAGATIYNVQRSETSGSGYALIGTATGTTYADSTAVLGTTYRYVVTAENSVGTSPISNEASAARLVSSVNNIVSFGPGATINGNSVAWVVPSGTDVKSLTPVYTVSPWATKHPANPSGSVDFTNPQTYTVIAEDLSTKTYTVMVMVYAAPITYNFDDATLQGWHNRVWDLSAVAWVDLAQNVYAMPVAINGGVIQPPSGENGLYGPRDYGVNQVGGSGDNHYNSLWLRSPEFYLAATGDLTVSLDGGQRNVNPPANDASVISAAVHNNQGGGFQGVALRRVSDGVLVLKANRTGFSQAALNALGSAGPYTLDLINTDRGDWGWIAMDNVSIPGVLAPPKDITSFAVTPYGSATIIGNNITLSVPPGTSVTALEPAITINGVSVSPASGIAQDFTSTVDYTVAALDGSTNTYHVTISVPPVFATTTTLDVSNEATGLEILTDGNLVEANHCGNNLSPLTIQGVLPFGTDESHIIAHGSDGTDNWGGFDSITDANFQALMKHVRWYQGTGYEMAIPGLIVGHTYRLQLISVQPNNVGVVVQGISLGAWSGDNTLVTATWVQPASKGSNLDVAFIRNGGEPKLNGYALHDMTPPGDGKDITSFKIAGIPATISGTNITLKMPFGLGWPNLAPTIEVSPLATVSPASEVVQDFTDAVTYTVTCANPGPLEETTKVYTVNVTQALDGPAVINVNYSGGTNANMNGVYTDDAVDRGSASQVAPATYGGNTWTDLGQPSGGNFDATALKDSKGVTTTVNLDTSMDTGIWADWSGLGGNKMLISGVQSGTIDYSTILTLTGLDPANTYDLYIAGQHNTGNDTRNYRVGATIKSKAFAGATDWTEGQTHVKLAGLIPSPTGTLVVEGSNHAMVNGFQLQDMGARSLNPEALIYTFGSTTLGLSTVPSGDQIKLVVPIGTTLNGFAPDITCSAGATLTPASATGQDFSTGPVTYTVLSEDGLTTSIYYATVILDPAAITSAALNISATDTGAEIINTGTLVEANHFGGVNDGMLAPAAVTLANGLTFGLDPAHMTSGWFAMHSTAAWSGAAAIENIPYKTLLGNVFWVAYGESVSHLDIPGLTVGHNYRLQLVSVNPANCKVTVEGGMPVNWSGSAPSLLTATWTATDTTANVVLTRAQGGGEINFNGYALHDMNPPASFSGLAPSQSITAGTSPVTLSGTVSALGPLYPAEGETVHVTINGVIQDTIIGGTEGAFSIDFDTSTLPVGDYPITYTYDGNATLVKAKDVSATLTVTGGGGGTYADWASANSVTGTPNEDSNNDGVQNGIAYFMGENGVTTNPGIVDNKVTWPKSSTFSGTWQVQISSDLSAWENVISSDNDTSVSYTLDSGLGKKFVRLLVTPMP